MSSVSAAVLLGLIGWTLCLLVLIEYRRTRLVLSGELDVTTIRPDHENLSPFMQRLARAHANCVEGLPVFGGLLLLALVAGHAEITDPLAPLLLALRMLQSLAHLASGGANAIRLRFVAFVGQIGIALTWCVALSRELI